MNRAVALAVTGVAIDIVGFGIVMPVLPTLVTHLGHMDLPSASRIAGWLMASFAIAQFFAGPVLGNLSDRYGRRVVLVGAMTAFAIDCALMALAPNLLWLFVGRFIAGLAGATIAPASAVIADTTPPEKRAGSFGLLGAAFGVGFIIGPALGGLVSDLGPRAPFVVAAILAGVNALLMLFFLPETLKEENRRPFRLRDAHVVGAFRPLFEAGNAAPLLIGWFLWQLGSVVYPATWAFWAAIRFGWDATAIGLSLAWVGLMSAVVQLFVTKRLVARLGERRTALIGLFSGAATLVANAFATQGWQVYAFFLIGALGQVTWPALNGLLSRMVDATRQGSLQGGIGSMNSVAAIIGPLIAAQTLGWGARHGLDGAAFLVAAALIASTGLIIALLVPASQLAPRSPGVAA